MSNLKLVPDAGTEGLFFLNDDEVLEYAEEILLARCRTSEPLESAGNAAAYLRTRYALADREVFGVLWLDTKHRLIDNAELFHGTIDGAVVHPREVVRSALLTNASAGILYHNHPSGISTPSPADIALTIRLRDALDIVDIRLLDHIIVAAADYTSLSRKGHL